MVAAPCAARSQSEVGSRGHCDPDGNGVEVYVDASDAWRREPQRVAQVVPLELVDRHSATSIVCGAACAAVILTRRFMS